MRASSTRRSAARAYAEAVALVNPSELESFSIVLMEAWREGTPALVAAGSDVMREHVERSGGGVVFDSYESYRDGVDRLLDDPELARRNGRGRTGRTSLESYSWPAVRERLRDDARETRRHDHRSPGASRRGPRTTPSRTRRSPGRTCSRAGAIQGELVAEHVHPDLSERRPSSQTGPGKRLIEKGNVILRYAIWSSTAELALRNPERVALCYHNITPGDYLRDFNPRIAELCDRGREALRSFPRPAALIADSSFNAADLREAGLGEAAVVPLLLDVPRTPERRLDAHEQPTILTVGRIVPNKRLEDVIKVFALYQRHRAPTARLILVGSSAGFENYRRALESAGRRGRCRASRLHRSDLEPGARRLVLAGRRLPVDVGARGLLRATRGGDRPRRRRSSPVSAGAVPETLGGAGILSSTATTFRSFAEALHEVVSSREPGLRSPGGGSATGESEPAGALRPASASALAPILDGS